MSTIKVEVSVHHADDVTFLIDTDAFLDAIGPVDAELEEAVNEGLDVLVEVHADFPSQCWYGLRCDGGAGRLLRDVLAHALDVPGDQVTAAYRFATCNWENWLSRDVGGTVWDVAGTRRILTIESGDFGCMRSQVEVRAVDVCEPEFVIAVCSSGVLLGCTRCRFHADTSFAAIEWTTVTRADEDGCALPGLFCPDCGSPLVAEVWI